MKFLKSHTEWLSYKARFRNSIPALEIRYLCKCLNFCRACSPRLSVSSSPESSEMYRCTNARQEDEDSRVQTLDQIRRNAPRTQILSHTWLVSVMPRWNGQKERGRGVPVLLINPVLHPCFCTPVYVPGTFSNPLVHVLLESKSTGALTSRNTPVPSLPASPLSLAILHFKGPFAIRPLNLFIKLF